MPMPTWTGFYYLDSDIINIRARFTLANDSEGNSKRGSLVSYEVYFQETKQRVVSL